MTKDRIGTREKIAAVLKRAVTSPAPGPSGPAGDWMTNLPGVRSMLPVVGWKIFYSGGGEVSSDQCLWNSAPIDRVLVVVFFHENGLRTLSLGCDEYFLDETSRSKYGLLVSDEEMEATRLRALRDEWRP